MKLYVRLTKTIQVSQAQVGKPNHTCNQSDQENYEKYYFLKEVCSKCYVQQYFNHTTYAYLDNLVIWTN